MFHSETIGTDEARLFRSETAATRDSARRLGLVSLEQMVATTVAAIEGSPEGVRILGVPEIRTGRL